jgi:uncharacterized repeat protein (TIGR02543 family)
MDAPRTVDAAWVTEHELTVVSPHGTPVGQGWYKAKAIAPFSISPTVATGSAGTRYAFSGWTGDSNATSDSATVVMDGPRMVIALWQTQHELTVISPHGTVAGAGWYSAGSAAPFSISPLLVDGPTGTRHAFRRWAGDSTATSGSAIVVMDGPRTATAVWETEHELTIVSEYGAPVGAGWYARGALATVSIESEVTVEGITYRFAGWTGDEERVDPSFGTVMTAAKRIVAVWVEVSRTRTGEGLPVLDWWAWLIAIAVILMLVVLFAWRRRRKEEEDPPPPPPLS